MRTISPILEHPVVPGCAVITVLSGAICRWLLFFVLIGSLLTRAQATIPAAAIADPLYFLDPDSGRYERLTASRYADIVSGKVKL